MVFAKANFKDRNRILVVEDDEMQAKVLEEGLTGAGFAVEVVSGGLAAVAKVESKKYDAILIDYNIPEMDGLALARVVGDFVGPAERPALIALTASPDLLAARENGVKSAFDLVLAKSCGLLTLIFKINYCIELAMNTAAADAARNPPEDLRKQMISGGPSSTSDRDRIRILVVEDNDLQQSLLTDGLEKRGYQVETASDGLEAIRKIREIFFDLIVIDYRVPELDGVAVASLLHKHISHVWRPRLVAFTASLDLLRDRVLEAGPIFDEIIDKSSGLDALLSSIDQLLRSSPNPTSRRLASAAV